MTNAWIEERGSKVMLRGAHLAVAHRDDPESSAQFIPLVELERITFTEGVAVSTQAMGALLRAGVAVHMMDRLGRPLGSFVPPTTPEGFWRLRQYQRMSDPEFQLDLARRIVAAKIGNGLRVLQRLSAARGGLDPAPAKQLRIMRDSALHSQSLEALLGAEGSAAACYWKIWAGFLPDEFPFERRSTRPPGNPVNACLSFLSAMVYNEFSVLLQTRGLEPALGALHATENGRWSLALDLMEPFRPAVIESLTVGLFTRKILNNEDFEPHGTGIYLASGGRRKVVRQFEERMDRAFQCEHLGHRSTMRRVFEAEVLAFKKEIQEPGSFQPFRIN